jgi:hypothetical protein
MISKFTLHHDVFGRLVFTVSGGEPEVGAEPVRAFPLSAPDHGLSIRSASGRELVWIDNIESLPPDLRRIVDEELTRREFMPVLTHIHHVSAATEPSEWEVDTDRGRTRFVLNSEEDIHRLGPDKAMLIDAQGVRYLIPALQSLDAQSRRILERYL